MFEQLRLSDLPAVRRGVLRQGTSTRPILWIIEEDGIEAVVKDFSRNGFFYRNIVGRFLIWREEKAYRRIRGLKGTPKFYRVIDGKAIVLERIRGESLEGLERQKRLPRSFFDALEALLSEVHERGIAHCDLKRAPNILLGHDGSPYVVDWSAAVCRSELPFFPLRRIYRRLILDDFHAITKMQLRHCPEEVSVERRNDCQYRSGAEKLIRRIRDRLRGLLKRVA